MDPRRRAHPTLRQERRAAHGRTASASPETDPAGTATGEHEALLRVAAAAAGAPALEEVLELAAEEALRAVGAASLAISRWDRARGVLRTLINVGELGEGEERRPADEVYAIAHHPQLERLVSTAQPYFNALDDPNSDPQSVALLRQLGKESDVAVPIIAEGELWGEVWASTAPGQPRFRSTDVRFLEAIAGRLALAIGRAELFSRVSRLAYEDPLTGLANRRAVEERLDRAVERGREGDAPVALVLCDLDGLKAINDSRGHDAGDRALAQIGAALVASSAALPGSLVGRLSGDEFCVLIEGGGLEQAREVALEALAILARDRDVPLSLSCGAAVTGPGTTTADALLRAADAAQYAAKRRGGGQFCTAEAGLAPDRRLHGRRSFRTGAEERVRGAVAELARLLEGELAGRDALDRLEAVVTALAEAVNAAAWAISFAAKGGDTIQSISTADDRDTRLAGLRVGLDHEVYALGDFPSTERLVAAGSGSFLVERSDPGADSAEVGLLGNVGHDAVLAAAAAGPDGTYLLELFADGETAALAVAETDLYLLARAAIPPRAIVDREKEQMRARTQRLELTSALGSRLARATTREEIVTAMVDELSALGYPVCAIVRIREDQHLEVVAESHGPGPGRWAGWSAPMNSGLLGRCLMEGRTVKIGNVGSEPDYRTTPITLDTRSELDVPVWIGGRSWGAITVQETSVDAFADEDARLLETVADQLGAALHSVELYEQLERGYLGTAEALSAALEAKDSYTAGHSQSIVRRSEAVGRRLGLSGADLRTLRYGAAFHDIGKLAVPEAILSKPGPLTAAERRQIEQHTVIGERILAPVDFLEPVRPLVRHAHERWDGKGYPDRLAGEAIPLGSRIIFACDAFDAMTTDRPYRAALPSSEALAELRRCAGSQFDPRVVAALLEELRSAS